MLKPSISFSKHWIYFSWWTWVCLMSSLVENIMLSWILSIVEIWWSRLSLYFSLASSRVHFNGSEISWSNLLALWIFDGASALISERDWITKSSFKSKEATLVVVVSTLESTFQTLTWSLRREKGSSISLSEDRVSEVELSDLLSSSSCNYSVPLVSSPWLTLVWFSWLPWDWFSWSPWAWFPWSQSIYLIGILSKDEDHPKSFGTLYVDGIRNGKVV